MKKHSQFKWQQYLQQNRSDISIDTFRKWCIESRPKKSVFDTEQELLQAISLYDIRVVKSQLKWRKYLKYNRPDINIHSFRTWCDNNRPKKTIFNTEQELLQTISLYDNRKNKRSDFNWWKYLQQNRPDINIKSFKGWCYRYRPKKHIFNTEQELLEAILLYDNRRKQSQFNYTQYLKENRPDINMLKFRNWCNWNRPEKSIFDTEQELIETLKKYDKSEKVTLS